MSLKGIRIILISLGIILLICNIILTCNSIINEESPVMTAMTAGGLPAYTNIHIILKNINNSSIPEIKILKNKEESTYPYEIRSLAQASQEYIINNIPNHNIDSVCIDNKIISLNDIADNNYYDKSQKLTIVYSNYYCVYDCETGKFANKDGSGIKPRSRIDYDKIILVLVRILLLIVIMVLVILSLLKRFGKNNKNTKK